MQQLRADESLAGDGLDDEAYTAVLNARRAETARALGERVVDLIADAETVIDQARQEGWGDPSLAAATVGRPRWWLLSPAPWKDLLAILAILAAAKGGSGAVETWQATAMWGASALAPDDPTRIAILIAAVCLVGTPASASEIVSALRTGSGIAAE